MPNRILREGILKSTRVDALSSNAEIFYRRLMSVVDDYGRYEALPKLLRAAVYPLKYDEITDSAIESWLSECAQHIGEEESLITVYEVRGHRYLQVNNFHQRTRAKTSRFPDPSEGKISVMLLTRTPAPVVWRSDDRHARTETDTYSETNTQTKPKASTNAETQTNAETVSVVVAFSTDQQPAVEDQNRENVCERQNQNPKTKTPLLRKPDMALLVEQKREAFAPRAPEPAGNVAELEIVRKVAEDADAPYADRQLARELLALNTAAARKKPPGTEEGPAKTGVAHG